MDQSWLDEIPDSTTQSDGLQIEGVLIRAPQGRVRLVTGHLCLDFDVDEVVEVKMVAVSDVGNPHFGIHVLLQLRTGARLLQACPSDVYRDLVEVRRRPFLMSCRSSIHILPNAPRFRAREQTFLRQYGVE